MSIETVTAILLFVPIGVMLIERVARSAIRNRFVGRINHAVIFFGGETYQITYVDCAAARSNARKQIQEWIDDPGHPFDEFVGGCMEAQIKP